MTDVETRATELLRLHQNPELLTVVNAWDVISASVVASTAGTKAIATASHAIAATYGYPDGEHIPLGTMLDMVGRIVTAVDLPVTADLEGGYGDAPEAIRRAIGTGVAGANIEDQLKPIAEAAGQVETIMKVAAAEGVPDFVLNARADAFARARDRDPAESLADAVERGRAYLDAGAPLVFVPALLDEEADHHAGRRLRTAAADLDRHPRGAIAGPPPGARRSPGLLRPDAPAGRPDRAPGAHRRDPPRWRSTGLHAQPHLTHPARLHA